MEMRSQKSRSALVHQYSEGRNKTCIDCHKGIAHHLPDEVEVYRGGSDEDHAFYESKKLACFNCHEDMQKPPDDDWD